MSDLFAILSSFINISYMVFKHIAIIARYLILLQYMR